LPSHPIGLLERPALPPSLSVPTVRYKLFVSGRSGVGKTALVATLLGNHVPPLHRETLGIEVSTLFWPAVPLGSERPVLFQLHFWDCGENALRKFEHLLPRRRRSLLLFSFTDRPSFEELPARLERVLQPHETAARGGGTRFDCGPHTAVTEADVAVSFDGHYWGLRVLRSGGSGVAGEGGTGGPIAGCPVGQLWQRDQMAAGVIQRGREDPEDWTPF
ncbi:ciliogenesis and planar polarity effector 2-like, partial [Coturnix japonica]|uniref:ciliogenesis and planar polarity effector 2-like n=1 Tax=Coturnix japonica TaxID=93934 RepID=UPI000777A0A7